MFLLIDLMLKISQKQTIRLTSKSRIEKRQSPIFLHNL